MLLCYIYIVGVRVSGPISLFERKWSPLLWPQYRNPIPGPRRCVLGRFVAAGRIVAVCVRARLRVFGARALLSVEVRNVRCPFNARQEVDGYNSPDRDDGGQVVDVAPAPLVLQLLRHLMDVLR